MSLRAKLARDRELAESFPPACTPPAGAARFSFERVALSPAVSCRATRFECLGRGAVAALVESHEQLAAALAGGLRAGAARGAIVLDGEFDTVFDSAKLSARGRAGVNTQRMALMTLLPDDEAEGDGAGAGAGAGGRELVVFALHFPSLFRADASGRYALEDAGAGAAAQRALVALLVDTRRPKPTWGGVASDLPALRFALPALAAAAGAGAGAQCGVRDVQREVESARAAGALPPDCPLGLAKVASRVYGVAMDKAMQVANWQRAPTAEMLVYAASDVVVLRRVARDLERGALFEGYGAVRAPQPPRARAAAPAEGGGRGAGAGAGAVAAASAVAAAGAQAGSSAQAGAEAAEAEAASPGKRKRDPASPQRAVPAPPPAPPAPPARALDPAARLMASEMLSLADASAGGAAAKMRLNQLLQRHFGGLLAEYASAERRAGRGEWESTCRVAAGGAAREASGAGERKASAEQAAARAMLAALATA